MARAMRRITLACILLAAAPVLACAPTSPVESPSSPGLSDQARVVLGEWRDPARGDRRVPYKIYLPSTRQPAPVIIFSHGLGGSREAAAYLLEYLAANGFVAVAIQHPGSDSSLLSGETDAGRAAERLAPAVTNPRAAIDRFGDIRFVIDSLEAENASGALAGRLDLSRLGMSGHSYGALTTLVAVGQHLAGGRFDFRDPRIDAAIVYSPNAPRNQDAETALRDIHTPILHFTGTEDRSPFDLEESPAARQIPFQTIRGADQYLIVFDGGDHMIYSGRVQGRAAMSAAQQAQTEIIRRESLTFWRAHLLGDSQALAALCRLPERVDTIAVAQVRAPRCRSSE